jgi:glycosyltransferase involved in cell wall biosynthesis
MIRPITLKPLVTVGIPTYRRPDLLSRSLSSVLSQSYSNLEILVSNNDKTDLVSRSIVKNLGNGSSRVRYFAQEQNIGPIGNFERLLSEARGEFFMWLADDDEISDKYVETLVLLLENHKDAVTAMGDWELINQEGNSQFPPQTDISQGQALHRILSLLQRPDDSAFYGLHRIALLRTCKFRRYSWPNQEALQGLAHPFMVRLTGLGPTVFAERGRAIWRNHEFGVKNYKKEATLSRLTWIATILRVTNYHWLFLREASSSLRLVDTVRLFPHVLGALTKQLLSLLSAKFIEKKS